MSEPTQIEDFKQYLDNLLLGSVPINTALKLPVAKAAAIYAKDKGLNNIQDVIRMSLASFLTKAGYLKNNS